MLYQLVARLLNTTSTLVQMVLLAAVPEVAPEATHGTARTVSVCVLFVRCQSGFEDEGIGSWLQHHQQVHPRIICIYIYIIHANIYIYMDVFGWCRKTHNTMMLVLFPSFPSKNHTVRNRFLGTKFSSWAEENHSFSALHLHFLWDFLLNSLRNMGLSENRVYSQL